MTKKKTFNFEDTISSLIKIVENMESGELSLEESLKNFENGIELTRKAQKAIAEAEQTVHLLLENGDIPSEPLTQVFSDEDESDL